MNKVKIINGLIAMFITMPIWLYLLYSILEAINASELVWFLYWIYIPASLFVVFVGKILGDDE